PLKIHIRVARGLVEEGLHACVGLVGKSEPDEVAALCDLQAVRRAEIGRRCDADQVDAVLCEFGRQVVLVGFAEPGNRSDGEVQSGVHSREAEFRCGAEGRETLHHLPGQLQPVSRPPMIEMNGYQLKSGSPIEVASASRIRSRSISTICFCTSTVPAPSTSIVASAASSAAVAG